MDVVELLQYIGEALSTKLKEVLTLIFVGLHTIEVTVYKLDEPRYLTSR
jgi:hypothetical protein